MDVVPVSELSSDYNDLLVSFVFDCCTSRNAYIFGPEEDQFEQLGRTQLAIFKFFPSILMVATACWLLDRTFSIISHVALLNNSID